MCEAESGKVFMIRVPVAGWVEGFITIIIIVIIGKREESCVDFGLEVGEGQGEEEGSLIMRDKGGDEGS